MSYIGAGISRFNTADELTVTGDVTIDTTTLVVDSTNNRVGVKVAPERDLHVKGSSGDPVHFKLEGDASDYARIMFDDGTTDNIGELRYNFGSDYMSFNTNSAERMRIDSSGSVGINVTPSAHSGNNGIIQVGSASLADFVNGAYLSANAYYDGSNNRYIVSDEASRYYQNGGVHAWESAASGSAGGAISFSERMRIAGSTFLIGKTSENMATAGTQFRSSGQALDITRSGGSGLNVNRLSNDGEVIGLFKDTTQFCSIGVVNGNNPFMSNDADNSGFQLAGTSIIPHYDGTQQNNAVDLGSSSVRFKIGYFHDSVRTRYFVGVDDSNTYIEMGGSDVMKFVTGGSEAARFDSYGNFQVGASTNNYSAQSGFGVNNTGATYTFISHANGTASGTSYMLFAYNGGAIGSIVQNGTTAVAYSTSSDRRLKSNIQDAESASSKIDAIQVRQFDWNADGSHQDYGLIAQELQPIEPMAVTGDADSDEMMGVDYSKLVPMLIKEIQELRSRVATLEAS